MDLRFGGMSSKNFSDFLYSFSASAGCLFSNLASKAPEDLALRAIPLRWSIEIASGGIELDNIGMLQERASLRLVQEALQLHLARSVERI